MCYRESLMRVAAVDLGSVRVGVAVSDELGLLAHPRPAMDGRNSKKLLADLGRFARTEGVDRFLVGLPLDMRGTEGRAASRARRFAEALAAATGRPVELVDERLTTVEAARRMREAGTDARRGRGRIDAAAAAVLLQAWLDRAQHEPGEKGEL